MNGYMICAEMIEVVGVGGLGVEGAVYVCVCVWGGGGGGAYT